jgi:hypothetical protein
MELAQWQPDTKVMALNRFSIVCSCILCVCVRACARVCVCVYGEGQDSTVDSEYVGQRMAWILGFQKNYSKITPINIFGRGQI